MEDMQYVAVPFIRTQSGIVAGHMQELPSELAAIERAEAMSREPNNAGAFAFKRSGHFGQAIIIKRIGEAPEGFDFNFASAEINRRLIEVVNSARARGSHSDEIAMGISMMLATAYDDPKAINTIFDVAKELLQIRARYEAAHPVSA